MKTSYAVSAALLVCSLLAPVATLAATPAPMTTPKAKHGKHLAKSPHAMHSPMIVRAVAPSRPGPLGQMATPGH